jgi:FdhE protein
MGQLSACSIRMVQRILEPGQIETLAQRSIPRVRLPDRARLFSRRAARLRELAEGAAIGDYLRLLAAIADAQHAALADFVAPAPDAAQLERAGEHRMPPIHAPTWARAPQWRDALGQIGRSVAARLDFPAGVGAIRERLSNAPDEWIEAQADALLAARHDMVDTAAAPFVMAALQVHWAALSSGFIVDEVQALDVPGVCPLCGSLPVASLVCAHSPYQGYRYLHCALCATEWHMVRVLCSQCGASGKDIGYQTLEDASNEKGASEPAAVRAETCEQCHSYRKILYQEKDPGVEPVADDLASLALDLLLGEHGYHRASGNPLLWQPTEA